MGKVLQLDIETKPDSDDEWCSTNNCITSQTKNVKMKKRNKKTTKRLINRVSRKHNALQWKVTLEALKCWTNRNHANGLFFGCFWLIKSTSWKKWIKWRKEKVNKKWCAGGFFSFRTQNEKSCRCFVSFISEFQWFEYNVNHFRPVWKRMKVATQQQQQQQYYGNKQVVITLSNGWS